MTLALHLFGVFLLAGCASTPSIPDEPASISGIITHISRSGGETTVLIEERPDQDSGDNKSSVRITPEARVLLDNPSGMTELRAEQLTVGSRASAWFVGPIAESYPTQTTAGVLLVHPH